MDTSQVFKTFFFYLLEHFVLTEGILFFLTVVVSINFSTNKEEWFSHGGKFLSQLPIVFGKPRRGHDYKYIVTVNVHLMAVGLEVWERFCADTWCIPKLKV